MKLTPLDYEIAKLIDNQGIDYVLAALCREALERGHLRLWRRLEAVFKWLNSPAGQRALDDGK